MTPEEIQQRENLRGMMRDAIRQVLSETHLSNEEHKQLYKDALHEWLDERAKEFGKWSLRYIGYAAFCLLVYMILVKAGWTPPLHAK